MIWAALLPAAAELARDLLRIALPSAAEKAASLENRQAEEALDARGAFRKFASAARGDSLARRLAAERDAAEIERLKNGGSSGS